MKKQLKGKQSFYDDKQRENVVSYYLMEDQERMESNWKNIRKKRM